MKRKPFDRSGPTFVRIENAIYSLIDEGVFPSSRVVARRIGKVKLNDRECFAWREVLWALISR